MIRNTVKDKFNYGSFVFAYYRFIDKFHIEPKSWIDLIEYNNYVDTESAINKIIADLAEQENK